MFLLLVWLSTLLPYTEASCALVDLTLMEGTNGSAVVDACIAKISTSGIFSDDQQMLRRIAFVETNYGIDSHTYSNAYNDGGIWQLSSAKYDATKNSNNVAIGLLTDEIYTKFGINWASTQWSDLRMPFYSALAARLYLEVLRLEIVNASIPLASNSGEQGSYWATYYTMSGETSSDFVSAVNELSSQGKILLYDYINT